MDQARVEPGGVSGQQSQQPAAAWLARRRHPDRPSRSAAGAALQDVRGGIWIKEWQSRPAVRFSADGLRWGESFPVPEIEAHADTHNSTRWVPELKKYVTMTRIHRGKPFFRPTPRASEWWAEPRAPIS